MQVYWAGPILGGVAAALIYQLLLAVSGNFTQEQMFLANINDYRHQRKPLRRESTVPLR